MGKKCCKVWKAAPLCLFWAVWKERNRISFENEELSIHRLKNSFVCNIWFWTKSVVNEGPLPLISFFDWLGSSWGLVIFCIPSSFCSCLLAPLVYICFWVSLKVPVFLIYIFSVCLLIKKNSFYKLQLLCEASFIACTCKLKDIPEIFWCCNPGGTIYYSSLSAFGPPIKLLPQIKEKFGIIPRDHKLILQKDKTGLFQVLDNISNSLKMLCNIHWIDFILHGISHASKESIMPWSTCNNDDPYFYCFIYKGHFKKFL